MMKALVLTDYNQFEVQDRPRPELLPDHVLIAVRACGICGSDVHGMTGSTGRRIPPIVMGHEAAGEIVEVGSAVNAWKPGDRATFDSTVYCGSCNYCRRGQVNLCNDRQVLGVSCGDYRRDGAFAEFIAVPERILYRLPDGISYEQAAMVEAVSVAVHAVERTPLKLNSSVAVIGSGMIGLLLIQALRVAGCGEIIAVDMSPGRLKLAGKLGATTSILANATDVVEQIRSLTGGEGVDAAFEVVGNGAALKTAIDSTRKGGSITLIGNLSPTVDMPLQAIVTRELTLIGSCASAGEYPACLDLIASGNINVTEFISATD
jgi:L-iditol 2-dehydrogenase